MLSENLETSIFDEFDQWLQGNKERFALPIAVSHQKSDIMQIEFVGVSERIGCYVTSNGISVDAISDIEEIGNVAMLGFETWPRCCSGGYICQMTIPEYQKVYSTLSDLYREEVFEPFLKWVNNKLAKATTLRIFQLGEGIVDGELLFEDKAHFEPSNQMMILSQMVNVRGEKMFREEVDDVDVWLYPVRLAL